ncbi:MAG: TetR/AcrR family transcriptional regulator [Candidatus Thiodiazotropha sp. L084R]
MNTTGINVMVDADKTRQALLEAAYEEIYLNGFQAASLNAILERTGVTKGALYHHFSSKKRLGYAVLDEEISKKLDKLWIQPLQKQGNQIDILIETIQLASQEITDQQLYLGCPLNNLAQEMSPIDAGFRQRIDQLYQKWLKSIGGLLSRGQLSDNVKQSIDTSDTALFILASLEGCLGIAKNAQSHDELKRCGEGLIGYLNNLRAETSST